MDFLPFLFANNLIVFDSFNRADNPNSLGNADTGQQWTYSTIDQWTINGKTAYINAGTNTNRAHIDSLKANNIYIQTKVSILMESTRLLFRRGVSSSNEWSFGTNTSNKYILQKRVESISTTVVSTNFVGTSGDILRVELRNDEIKCFLNGVLIITFVDPHNINGTYHGLYVITNAGIRKFDDFEIGEL